MNKIKGAVCGAIIAVIAFLLQWVASDILDNQTYFSPHEVMNELMGTSTETSIDTAETYTSVEEDEDCIIYTIRVSSANVRTGAGTSYDVLKTVKQGCSFTGTGNVETKSSGVKWYEIYLNDEKDLGWISEKVCTAEEKTSSSDLPKEDETKQPDTQVEPEPAEIETEEVALETEVSEATEQPTENDAYIGADDKDKIALGRISDAELENKLPALVEQDSKGYSAEWYLIKKILHILLLIVAIFVWFIIVAYIFGKTKIWGWVFFIGAIILIVFSIKGTTKYKYKYEDKYLIESVESTDGVYNILYHDGEELMQMQVDSSRTQLLQIEDCDSSEYLYKFEKKTKNLFYYLTEMKPQERTIFLIY